MTITRIRVPSEYYRFDPDPRMRGEVTALAEFTLGVGPCGKTVERLNVQYTVYGVVIEQVCTCTEMKEFVYPWHTITGRVEVTHG